jgi:Zn2+/Cd2+-exporting ATPase
MAQNASTEITQSFYHDLIPIEGMSCSKCALMIETSIDGMDGVMTTSVSYTAKTMRVEYDSSQIQRQQIEKQIKKLGFRVPTTDAHTTHDDNRQLVFSLASGGCLLVGWLGGHFLGFPFNISLGCYLAAYLFGGYDTVRHALQALRERQFDTDLLMVMAAVGAAILGKFSEGALLLFLFSLGHALEERALDKARNAIDSLTKLTPKTAVVKWDDGETEVLIDDLEIGNVVIVRPGMRIPVDGDVVSGRSGVDQAPVTGESMPVDKTPGDTVFAGCLNGEGALEVEVTRLANDSTLANIMRLIVEAQTEKSPTQRLTEKFTRKFVPLVLIGCLLLIAIPPLFGVPFSDSFLRAMMLLVATSPCALALGTPSAILAGIAQSARNGVLVKGGAHLENLGRLQAIAFDKTGTITKGEPTVTDVIPLKGTNRCNLLAMAAAVESRSAHPLAQAVVKGAAAEGLTLPEVGDAESMTGHGIEATVGGKTVRVGSLKWFDDLDIEIPKTLRADLRTLEAQGKTTMLVAVNTQPVGLLAVADVIQPEARNALAALRKMKIRQTIMLTGDNPRVAAHIAQQAGMTDYRAELLPEDKVATIRELMNTHDAVAMVGDGVNDAPALANATIGIAMGGAGTDVALETADVALMGDDLSKLPFAVGLGRATRAIIIQNLVIASAVIVALTISSVIGLATIGAAVIFHEGSTIVVVLNSLRLLRYGGVKRNP